MEGNRRSSVAFSYSETFLHLKQRPATLVLVQGVPCFASPFTFFDISKKMVTRSWVKVLVDACVCKYSNFCYLSLLNV